MAAATEGGADVLSLGRKMLVVIGSSAHTESVAGISFLLKSSCRGRGMFSSEMRARQAT